MGADQITKDMTRQEVLAVFPGTQRALFSRYHIGGCILFSRYHIGGCSSCRLARLARVGLIVLLAQLALGGYVRHAGAGLACPNFPLCSGDLFPGQWLAGVHWAHRWLGIVLLGLFVHVALVGRNTGNRRVSGPTRLVAILALAQVSLGIATVLLQLAPVARAAHAAVGYALWAGLVWVSVRAECWSATVAPAARPGAAREAIHAA